MDDPNAWVWQGFFGPMAAAAAGKAITDADTRAGVWVPLPGEPPRAVDVDGAMGMFAVQTRVNEPVPRPEGLLEAAPDLVGRLVNA
jgi:hypothetical protein